MSGGAKGEAKDGGAKLQRTSTPETKDSPMPSSNAQEKLNATSGFPSSSSSSSSGRFFETKSSGGQRLLSNRFRVGQSIDVLDHTNRWAEAEILKIDDEEYRLFISYTYWNSDYDEWVTSIDDRTAPLNTHTYFEGGTLKQGQRIEVRDEVNKWMEAYVIDDDFADGKVKIHYKSYHSKFDEEVHPSSGRIRPYGRDKVIYKMPLNNLMHATELKKVKVPGGGGEKRKPLGSLPLTPPRNNAASASGLGFGAGAGAAGAGNSGAQNNNLLSNIISCDDDADHTRQISEFSDKYSQYLRALEAHRLHVEPMPGDGNCFFRSVAHQVYGSDEFHDTVRQKCMDYMEQDAAFFSQFVEGGMDSFPLYVRAKRLNACWGDDPEIQAICEIYDRPAEIWAYDQQSGARKLRTFHEHAGSGIGGGAGAGAKASAGSSLDRPCIRLSYYGGGHYDSMVSSEFERNLLRTRPGDFEEAAIGRAKRIGSLASVRAASSLDVQQAKADSDREATELEQLELAVTLSRREHVHWAEVNLDQCLQQSMRAEHVEVGSATTQDQAADLVSMQRDILESVREQSEREFLAKMSEDELLEQARLASLRDLSSAPTASAEDEHLQLAMKMADLTEDEALALVMQASVAEEEARQRAFVSASTSASASAASGAWESEDEMLRMVLQQSLAESGRGAGALGDDDGDDDLQAALQASLRK